MSKIAPFVAAALLLLAPPSLAQQVGDTDYRPQISDPAFASEGPTVAIDSAHRNFHTLDGRYAAFAALLRADGYRPQPLTVTVTQDALATTRILVVANAEKAFSPAEIAAIKAWVEQGGALFLIADHAPFGEPAAPLAAAFGVGMGNGYVAVRQDGKVTSRIVYAGRALGKHPIIAGGGPDRKVRRVQTFTGQSLSIPPGATALLILPEDALEVAGSPEVAALRRGESAPGQRVGGRAQAVALEHGKGRVVIAGEAATFTAQQLKSGEKVGLEIADDERFARNVMGWLARAIK